MKYLSLTANHTTGKPLLGLFVIVSLGCMALVSCRQRAAEMPANESATEKTPDEMMLTQDQITSAGVRWGIPEQKREQGFLSTSGEFRVHQEHIAMVSAFSDGIVAELFTGINKPVAKGQRIAVISKPELLDLQQEYLETKDKLRFLQQEYERYTALTTEQATAGKNVQKAESEWRAAQTRLQLLAAKLRLYQIDPDELRPDNVQSRLTIYAPFAGIITRTLVSTGSAVQNGSPICELVDLSKMHADLFLFEKDLPSVKAGQTVYLQTGGSGAAQLKAHIFSIDPTLDPDCKAVRAHAQFDAPPSGGNMINGAYLQARIEISGDGNILPAIPSDCVLKEADGFYVYALDRNEQSQYYFKKLAVQPCSDLDKLTIVRPLVAWGSETQIVLKGAYFVAAQGANIEVE